MSIVLMISTDHLILCHPLLLLPSIFPSVRVFSNESALRYQVASWSFTFSISPSNEYSGLISFRINWFDLLAVQRTLKSLRVSQPSGKRAYSTQRSYELCRAGPPKMDGSWGRVLTKSDPLEKEMATHSSIVAWRIPLTV